MLQKNFQKVVERVKDTIPQYPLEVLFSFLFGVTIAFIVNRGPHTPDFVESAIYLFLSVFVSYIANQWTTEHHISRGYYYLTGIVSAILLPVFGYYFQDVHYIVVAFILTFLVYLITGTDRSNITITNRAVRLIKSLFISWIFLGIIMALLSIILLSVSYLLFELDNKIFPYLYGIIGSVSFVILLIYYNSQECDYKSTFFRILIHYILTISLLIYTVILYIYMGKIIYLWELPEGNLSYITIMYISLFFMTRAVSNLMEKQFVPSFFRYASFLCLAPLVLLWIGAYVRVAEYGLTIDRGYLLIVAFIETVIVLLCLNKKTERYILIVGLSIVLLFAGTYIPYINVKDLSAYSQSLRPQSTEGKTSSIPSKSLYIKSDSDVQLEGSSTLRVLQYPFEYKTDSVTITISRKYLQIKGPHKEGYKEKLTEIISRRLKDTGNANIDELSEEKRQDLLKVVQGPYTFVFSAMTLSIEGDSVLSVDCHSPVILLTR
ncbi:MAG: hypothetical protein ACRC9Q_06435 [Bacteroidales bacterium]